MRLGSARKYPHTLACDKRLRPLFPVARRRRGILAFELLLILPIILLLILAMVQFSLTLHARQQLVAASREGCRIAALGGNLTEVERTIKRTLGNGRLADADIEVTDESGAVISEGQTVPSGESIAVWLRLPTAHVVPDLLRFIGYTIKDDELVARTLMRRE
ncbi:MAG: TadE/TadG family type IV pilus assembly protein [Gemmatales bacterium]